MHLLLPLLLLLPLPISLLLPCYALQLHVCV
jgi:hypothetical protein